MLLPIENTAIQFQTNMSGMINMNWLKSFAMIFLKILILNLTKKIF